MRTGIKDIRITLTTTEYARIKKVKGATTWARFILYAAEELGTKKDKAEEVV